MRARLSASQGDVLFNDLRAHAARDAIIVVAEGLDLIDVAMAVARDDTAVVQRWIEDQKLTKPTTADLARWAADPAATFESLVVQPFVLVRPRQRRPAPLPS